AKSQRMNGRPYIGEYLDECTGQWLGDSPRSRYYNHSTFCDLVIGGLVGFVPSSAEKIEIHPLLREDDWDWFCLDGVPYHGAELTIIWDRDGSKFSRYEGLSVWLDGRMVAESPRLERVVGKLSRE